MADAEGRDQVLQRVIYSAIDDTEAAPSRHAQADILRRRSSAASLQGERYVQGEKFRTSVMYASPAALEVVMTSSMGVLVSRARSSAEQVA